MGQSTSANDIGGPPNIRIVYNTIEFEQQDGQGLDIHWVRTTDIMGQYSMNLFLHSFFFLGTEWTLIMVVMTYWYFFQPQVG